MIQLSGNDFCLREWKLSDEASLIRQANNINVSRFLADRFPYPYTTDNAKGWLNYQTQKNVIDNLVIDIDGELVGGIGIEPRQDIFRKTARIGYWLGEVFWGKGIMAEAVKLMVDYTFENLTWCGYKQVCLMATRPRCGFWKGLVLLKNVYRKMLYISIIRYMMNMFTLYANKLW